MDQYLLIPFLVRWTSINPSYFDVNYRGTRFWPTATSVLFIWGGCHLYQQMILWMVAKSCTTLYGWNPINNGIKHINWCRISLAHPPYHFFLFQGLTDHGGSADTWQGMRWLCCGSYVGTFRAGSGTSSPTMLPSRRAWESGRPELSG